MQNLKGVGFFPNKNIQQTHKLMDILCAAGD
jgi:hypothetical protein